MKLLYCLDCNDVVRLIDIDRKCECGSSGGKYTDESAAVIYGHAVPFGIMNNEFLSAALEGTENWPGAWFRGFVIPSNSENITWQTLDSAPTPD